MRWVYPDPFDEEENTARNAIVARIDAWWQEFACRSEQLDQVFKRRREFDLPAWMHQHFQTIDPRLMWEYGPGLHAEGHRLVMTCESDHHLQPLVDAVIKRAPKVTGWEFYPYRVPEPLDMALATVMARGGSEAAGNFTVRVARGAASMIDLEFVAPHVASGDDQNAFREAFVLAESLLGEEILGHWVSGISVAPPRKKLFGLLGASSHGGAKLDQLQPTVLALIDAIRSQLPDCPYARILAEAGETHTWSLMKMEPPEQDDYPAKTDLFVSPTSFQDLFVAQMSPQPFNSGRFSRCGETFCYLKLDGRDGLDEEHFKDRGELEDALTQALAPMNVGGLLGGGTGRIYSYVDMALTDLARAVPVIRQLLRRGNIHKRSWLLFFDAELADEWIGIYDDTPPPPK